MKTVLLGLVLLTVTYSFAQQKDKNQLVKQTYLLSHTVFGTKDSVVLERLFAKQLSYGHSKGKIESRSEALFNISRNTSVYSDTAVSNIIVLVEGKTAVVRHRFTAKENKSDGSVVSLNFTMLLVWTKENKQWKLLARQAVALPQ